MPPPTLRSSLRALPPAAWILFGGTFINRFGTFVVPFLILYFTRRGYSPAEAGLAVAAYGAGHLCSALVGGHLADRFGRRETIALSMFASAAAMLALSQATGFIAITILTALAGLATELYRPAAGALLADLVPPEQRVVAFSMYRLAINLGFAAGPSVAGFLADRSFILLFLGDAASSVIYGCVAIFFLPRRTIGVSLQEPWAAALRLIRRDRKFLLFLSASTCLTIIDFQMGSTFALHVRDNGYPSSTYGLLISFNGLLIVLFELLITSWTQRHRPRTMIALGYFLAGLGFALTGFAHSIPAIALTVVVWTLGEMISSPVTGAYVANLAPEAHRGRYMGFWVLTWSFGMILGPPLGTLAYTHHPWIVWGGCGALGVLAATLALMDPDRSATRAAATETAT